MARQRHGRFEDLTKKRDVALIERGDGGRRGTGDAVEDAKQSVAETVALAEDQLGIIEIVPGVELHADRKSFPKTNFPFFIQERNLDPVNFGGVFFDNP